MVKVAFKPSQIDVEVEPNTKILLAAKKGKIPLRFGCAACRCGTCAVSVSSGDSFSPMRADEKALLERMKLSINGDVRLSCQARVIGDVTVDVAFQDTYSPDDGDDSGEL